MNEREIQSRLKRLWGATGMPFQSKSRSEYQSQNQSDVMQQWLHWIELGSSGVVYGDHGMGKSVTMQKVKNELSPKMYSVIVLTHTSLSAGDVLCALCQILGVDASFRRSRTARQLLENWQREGKKPVLLVDEAQNLSTSALEEIRLLMCASVQQNGKSEEQLILSLCGDEELLPRLQLAINAPLLSRLGYHLKLEPLSEKEVESYLQARFEEVAVGTPPIDDGAIRLIHKACNGNPRKINHLLQHAIVMLLDSTNSQKQISVPILQKALIKVPSLNTKRNQSHLIDA